MTEEGKSEQIRNGLSNMSTFSGHLTFVEDGFSAKVEILLSMPLLKERRVGWLVLCQINGAFPSKENTDLEWTFFMKPDCKWTKKSSTSVLCACTECWREMWTTC